MPITEFCKTDVSVIDKNSSVVEAARRMREEHVGDLVVCQTTRGGSSKPIGILTDRDIVVGAVALDIPLHRSFHTVRVEDIMTPTVVTVNENAGIYETIHLMETYGVRRLPVVSNRGALVGIISSDDLLELLSQEMVALSRLSQRQKVKEKEVRI